MGKNGKASVRRILPQMQSLCEVIARRILKVGARFGILTPIENEGFNFKKIPNVSLADKKVIRWGNRIEVAANKATIVYNKAEAIANASNKKLAREIFAKEKVRCPKLINLENIQENDYPIIARPSQHAKGENFVILNTIDEFKNHFDINSPQGWYYSEFIDKQREFRVHCAHGKILAIMEKPKGEGIAWNLAVENQAFTRLLQEEYIFSVCIQALKAIKALGLDFGGVDVLYKEVEGKTKAYILEVNTSPAVDSSEYVSLQYAKYFDWLNRTEKRRDHWDFSKFEAASSFAWKQAQLMN